MKIIALVKDSHTLKTLASDAEAVEHHASQRIEFIQKQIEAANSEAKTALDNINNRLVEWLIESGTISPDMKVADYEFKLSAKLGCVIMVRRPIPGQPQPPNSLAGFLGSLLSLQ